MTILAAAVLGAAAATGTTAAAATMHTEVGNDAIEMTVQVGYDGVITYGKAFPVTVTIRNRGEDFEGRVGVNAYVTAKEYDRFETPVSLPAGAERQYVLAPTVCVRQEVFTAEVTRDGEVICAVNAKPERLANPSAMLIGVLSSRAQNLNNLTISRENDTLGRYELWQTIPLTAESFPEEAGLMNSFGMIVTDDIDPATLNDAQKEALDRWLQGGRILLCGGGAAGVRAVEYFSKYTGLTAGHMETSGEVTAALQHAIGRAETGGKAEVSLFTLEGAEPLVQDSEGRGLIWKTGAAAGRIYTTAFEAGDAALNADPLMHYFWQQLLVNNDQDLYNTVLYAGSSDGADSIVFAGWNAPVRARSRMLPAMLIAAGVPVLASLCWLALKKADRQKLMWIVLPVLAAAAAGGLAALAGGAETNRPMAVITENLVQDSGGTIRSYRGITAAAPEYGRHSYSMQGERLRMQNYDYVDYMEEEEEKKTKEPTLLRTCYTTGGENSLTAENDEPWALKNMMCEAESGIRGRIEASVWMEEDGIHGEIINGTETGLTGGHMITNAGYVSVPDLAPGEKAEVVLRPGKVADPQNPKYADGLYYPDDSTDLWNMVNAALNYRESYDGNAEPSEEAARSSMINGAANQLKREKNGTGYSSTEGARFLYSAVPETLPEAGLKADGRTVEQKTQVGQLTTEMTFLVTGRTGVVYRAAGMDVPARVETDGAGMPLKDMKNSIRATYYHPLNEVPTFRFDLSGVKDARIRKLRVVMEAYYNSQTRVYALNTKTGAWDEIRLNEDITGPERYVDGDGNLYIQFRPDTQEMYAEIPTPMITLEGRSTDA